MTDLTLVTAYPIEWCSLAMGRFTDEYEVDQCKGDERLLEDFDALIPGRSGPLQGGPAAIGLLKVKLLLEIHVTEVRGPLLANTVWIRGDVDRRRLVDGLGLPPEEHFDPDCKGQFDTGDFHWNAACAWMGVQWVGPWKSVAL